MEIEQLLQDEIKDESKGLVHLSLAQTSTK